MQTTSLEAIHEELKSLNERLSFIEDLVEQVILRELPRTKISRSELVEIKRCVAQMRKGERATLEDLNSA